MEKKLPNRWLILLAATVSGMLTGTSLVFRVFRNPLMEANGWGASEVTLAYSGFMLMCLAGTFLGGPVQRRFKPAHIIFVAGILQGIGFFTTGCISTLPMLYVCYSFIAGLGNGFLYSTAVGVATRWFPDKKGMANGILVGFMAMSPLIFSPLANALIESMSVANSFKVMGCIMIVGFGIFAWFHQDPPEGWQPEGWIPPARSTTQSSKNYTIGEMLKTPFYWALLIAFTCAVLSGIMMTGQASAIAQQQASLTPAQGALMTGLLALFSCIGRLGLGTLSDKVGRFNVYIVVALITAIDLLFFFNGAHSFGSFMVALFFVACSNGAMMSMCPGIVSDNFGQQNFSAKYPFVYCGYTICSFVGPLLASSNFEATGNYQRAVTIAGIVALCGCVGMIICKHMSKKLKEKEWAEAENAS